MLLIYNSLLLPSCQTIKYKYQLSQRDCAAVQGGLVLAERLEVGDNISDIPLTTVTELASKAIEFGGGKDKKNYYAV